MSKVDIVNAAVAAIQAGEAQVLSDAIGSACDQSALEQKASDGTLTQGDLDAAIKAATDPLNAQIADLQAKDAADVQALADAQAKAASDLAAVQSALDAMTAKEQLEEKAVADVQAKVEAAQASFDAVKAIILGVAPAPASAAS